MENMISIAVKGNYLEISFNYSSTNKFSSKVRNLQKVRDFLFDWKVKIDGNLVYDANLYPNNYHVELNGVIINNQELDQIFDINFGSVKVISLILPNTHNIGEGRHKVSLKYQKIKFSFQTQILHFDESIKFPTQSQVENINLHVKQTPQQEEENIKYFKKVRNIIFLVILVIYSGVGLFFFSIFWPTLFDPLASQYDAGLGPGLALVLWIFLGLFLIPISYGKLRKTFR